MRKDGLIAVLHMGGCLPGDRLDAKDKKILLIWILAGLLGAGVGYRYFYRAFPEAAVEFKVPRADALDEARAFVSSQGAQTGGLQSSIVFDVDDTAKTYLEREVGLEQANRIMAGDAHIWYWQTRFFRPLQKEEFDVRVDPGGQITGFEHVLEEVAPGARLDRAAAQSIAESFLRDTLHRDLSRWDFRSEEANLTERPNRRDWSFTWELRGFRAKDAPYHLNVTLAGDRVDGYQEFLNVPEVWKLDYERLRSSNNLLEYVALIPFAFLLGGCLYVIFSLGRRGLLEWKGGLILGAFVAVLFFGMTMNQFPLDRAGYDTNTSYSSFILNRIGLAAILAIGSALTVVIAVVPGEPFYRISQPGKIQLGAGLRLSGIRTKEFFFAGVIGICLAAIHIGYITVFYIVSGKLGGWAPQDVRYTDVVSTSLPWMYPLTVGIYAATNEEFLFRLFAIPFLTRVTKSKYLAVILPAFAWGFLHSNYPQQPAYIRGIEVGLMGIVAGLVMLRWGIWATLIWHYTVDAFLISTSLMRSSGAYLRISGVMIGSAALIPLAIAAYSYFARGKFENDGPLLNAAHPLVESPEAASGIALTDTSSETVESPVAVDIPGPQGGAGLLQEYTAMPGRTLGILLVCAVIGVGLLIGVKRESIGDFIRFEIDATEATTRADQVLRDNKIDPATYHHATTNTFTFNEYNNEYLRRTIGFAATNRIYQTQVPSAFWTTRYFRDSQNEEYLVVLRTDGSLHSLHHTLDDQAPGANLAKEMAQARAESYLLEHKTFDLSTWKLVETKTDKRPARTDHRFVWEQISTLDSPPQGQAGAHARLEVVVQGDEISSYRTFIRVPEAWSDAESRTTLAKTARTFGRIALIALAIVTVLVVFFRNLKGPEIAEVPWRRIAKWSAWVMAAAAITHLTRMPELFSQYTTTMPLIAFYGVLFTQLIIFAALYAAAAFLLLGLAWFFLQKVFGRARMPGWCGMSAAYYRDAFCIAVLGSAAMMGVSRISTLIAHWPILRHTLAPNVPMNLDAINPAAATIASAVWSSYFIVGVLALSAGLIATYIRSRALQIALVIVVAALMTGDVATTGSFARDAAYRLLFLVILWLGVTRVSRFNLMGYFLIAAILALVPGAIELLQQPNPYFHANGYAVLIFALGLLAWPLVMWHRAAPAS